MSGESSRGPGGAAIRIGVVSLGCSKNLVDTEVMLGHLGEAGARFVQDVDDADVVIVNTCSFIESSREESIRAILDAGRLKQEGRLKRLVVAGCLVQRYGEELRRELPEVDAFLGLDELASVVRAAGLAANAPRSDLPILPASHPVRASGPAPATYLYDARTPRVLATAPWTAFVKIAEGCDHTCSFCAIPAFRGVFRSRPAEDVVAEARALSARGVREVNLIAQDSSHYGRDRGAGEDLADLLERLDGVEALRWIRVHYLYPNTVTSRLVEAMASLPRVVKYVDVPLQHAHADTLRRMRRGGSAESHRALLDRFRAAMPGVALRTTFIVGFPGETEAEFRSLLEFVRETGFDHVGAFAYSHEESTSAWLLEDDVPAPEKEERRGRLLELQQSITFERNRGRVGSVVEVLVEGAHAETEHLLVGRMSTQAPEVDGQVLLNDGVASPGSFARVEITETAGYDVVGRILGAA